MNALLQANVYDNKQWEKSGKWKVKNKKLGIFCKSLLSMFKKIEKELRTSLRWSPVSDFYSLHCYTNRRASCRHRFVVLVDIFVRWS
jgi:hypothetical protein